MELGTLFWTRVANVALVIAVLLGYQVNAQARAQKVAEQEEAVAAQQAQTETAAGGYADGEYTGTATGFSGDLTVSVTVSGGQITDVQIVSTQDDAEYIDKASALLEQIVDNQGTDGLDAVSGATFSSNGILDAVNNALEGAAASTTDSAASTGSYTDGEYTGTATGFSGDLTVSVTVSGGQITDVQIVSTQDDAEYIDKASALLQQIVDNQGTDGLDAVSGATFSSNGILDAFNNAMEGQ